MKEIDSSDDSTRRTLLRMLAATGLTGAGIAATAGSSVADSDRGQGRGNQGQGRGRGRGRGRGKGHGRFNENFEEFKRDIERDGMIVDECEEVTKHEPGDEVTFKGQIRVTAIDLTNGNELTLSGRLKGNLKGRRSERINVRFEDVALGSLRHIFTIQPVSDPEDCPIVELNIGRLFREVLGMEINTETVELDIVAIFGEDNLIGAFLCSVARRFSPR